MSRTAEEMKQNLVDEPLIERCRALGLNQIPFTSSSSFAVPLQFSNPLSQRLPSTQQDVVAQYNLGVVYLEGQGVPENYVKAFECFEKAAAQGLAAAQFGLGLLYDYGEGVARDYAKAFECFEEAAAQKFAAAQNNLGWIVCSRPWCCSR